MTDIGFCSVPVPWTIPEGADLPDAAETIGMDTGDGLADQLGKELHSTIEEELSTTVFDSGFFVSFEASRVGTPRFTPRFGALQGEFPGPSDDDLCIDTHYDITSGITVPIIFTPIPCSWNLTVRLCGRFVPVAVEDEFGTERFDAGFEVTQVDSISAEVSSGPGCSSAASGADETLESELATQAPEVIAEKLNESLWVRELPVEGFAPVSTCPLADVPEAERNQDCREQFPGVRARCEQRDGDDTEFCYWNLEISRFEMLPTRLEIVLDDNEGEDSFGAMRASGGTPVSGTFCRNGAPEEGESSIAVPSSGLPVVP